LKQFVSAFNLISKLSRRRKQSIEVEWEKHNLENDTLNLSHNRLCFETVLQNYLSVDTKAGRDNRNSKKAKMVRWSFIFKSLWKSLVMMHTQEPISVLSIGLLDSQCSISVRDSMLRPAEPMMIDCRGISYSDNLATKGKDPNPWFCEDIHWKNWEQFMWWILNIVSTLIGQSQRTRSTKRAPAWRRREN
jgi:hypothetical protein